MTNIVNLDSVIVGFNGDPAHTPVYAVPSATMKVAEAVINATWNEAQGNKALFIDKMTTALDGWLSGANVPTVAVDSVSVPSIAEPNVDIPTSIDTSTMMATFDSKYQELVAMLVSKFTDFRASYFPTENAGYAAAEAWLADAIANPAGLPPDVLAQLLSDDQARIMADRQRSQDNVLAQFASRRFPLPPGAAASAVVQIEQKAQDELAESSRKLTALSVEMQKFNVEKLLGLRGMAMDSATKYIAALASGPELASKVFGVAYDAQSKLITSASTFYNARIQAAEVTSKVAQYNNSIALDAASKNQAAELQMVENKLKGLVMEIQALAQMCTALYNNLHTGATVSTSGGSTVNASLA